MKTTLLKLTALCAFLISVPISRATEWYVSGMGNDAQPGTSAETAFRSLQKAADLVNPGDTVTIGDGIYTNSDTFENSAVLRINRGGKEGAWVTWKAAPGAHPEIRAIGWNSILITCSYNIFDGLTVTGQNDSLVLQEALQDEKIKEKGGKKYPGDPKFNTNGIFVTGRLSPPVNKPHHNIIRNCMVSKMPGGGVIGIETDYLTVEDNLIFDNAWFMRYGGSGLTTLNNWSYDAKPGYHVIFQRNKIWNNRTNVPWSTVGRLSDGNGIILDVTDQEENGATNMAADAVVTPTNPTSTPVAQAKRPEWTGRTLIANNISAYNGGSGIHTFRHKHADIINNTVYSNGHNVGYADLFAGRSEDIVIMNNIIIPRAGGKVTTNGKNTNVRWDYNLYPFAQDVLKGSHDIVADPMIEKLATDLRNADFHLKTGSPALDSGSDEVPLAEDLEMKPRPAGMGRDRGAYEQ